MDRPPIVDTHVHFFDLGHPDLRYVWLEPDFVHPILGDIDAMKSRRYDATALWAEARFAGLEGFVHVQAAIGSADPVAETRWLTTMAESSAVPFTVVGHVDLGEDSADRLLDEHAASPLFVGVRDFASEPYLASGDTSARFERSLAELADRSLVFDLDCEWPNLRAARSLAERHPGLSIVLEHLAFPRSRDDAYFADWAAAMADLAAAPNVTCKISGIGMTDPRGDATTWGRWIATCLDTFGPDRCVLGSNWPLDRLVSSYDAVLGVYRDALRGFSRPEQEAVCADNARRIYRVPAAAGVA